MFSQKHREPTQAWRLKIELQALIGLFKTSFKTQTRICPPPPIQTLSLTLKKEKKKMFEKEKKFTMLSRISPCHTVAFIDRTEIVCLEISQITLRLWDSTAEWLIYVFRFMKNVPPRLKKASTDVLSAKEWKFQMKAHRFYKMTSPLRFGFIHYEPIPAAPPFSSRSLASFLKVWP